MRASEIVSMYPPRVTLSSMNFPYGSGVELHDTLAQMPVSNSPATLCMLNFVDVITLHMGTAIQRER
jgi:hypothetical protein